jgi:hypothetical protein
MEKLGKITIASRIYCCLDIPRVHFYFAGGHSYTMDPTCCTNGAAYGKSIFRDNFSSGKQCEDKTQKSATDVFCQIIFRQCCKQSIKDGFCTIGRSLAL